MGKGRKREDIGTGMVMGEGVILPAAGFSRVVSSWSWSWRGGWNWFDLDKADLALMDMRLQSGKATFSRRAYTVVVSWELSLFIL